MTDIETGSAPGHNPEKPGGVANKTFRALRNRNFRLYFTGQVISNTGNFLTNVALVLLVLKITGSGLVIGLLAACEYGPMVFLSAWAGAIADRSDKRHLLFVTQSLEMCQSAGLAIMAFSPHPSVPGLFALATAGGILLAFDNPLRRSFVTELVQVEDIPNAVVLNSVMINISRIVGPALAGLLIVTVGFGWCFSIDAATYLAVLFCLYLMRPAELRRQTYRPKSKNEVREGLLYVASMPSLWISFVMAAGIYLFAYNFSTTLPLFVTDALHSPGELFTVLYSTFSLGSVVSGLIVAHRGLVQLRYVILGALAMGIMMLVLSSTPGAWTAVPAAFLMGMASIVYVTSTTAIVQVEAKHEMHGRLLALQTILTGGGAVLGAPILGWTADTFGGRAPLIVGGMVCLLSAGFGYFANRRYNQGKLTS